MRTPWLAAAGFTALLAACSTSGGGGDAGSATDAFVGTWSCTGFDTLLPAADAGVASIMDPTSSMLTVTANPDGTIKSANVSGGTTCQTQSSVAGSTATLESGNGGDAGLPCFIEGLQVLAFTGGTGTLSGGVLSHALAFTLSGTVTYTPPDGGPPELVDVTAGTSADSCTRM